MLLPHVQVISKYSARTHQAYNNSRKSLDRLTDHTACRYLYSLWYVHNIIILILSRYVQKCISCFVVFFIALTRDRAVNTVGIV